MATSSERVIGIDLGTTNSCVAIVENGVPTVIPNRGGYKTTPSMIAVTEAGKRLVGHIAKRQAITNAENTVYAAKRLIGRKWSSPQVRNAVATSSYRIVEGPHQDVRIVLREKEYSVAEISAMVLQEMKVIAEDYLGEPVTKAVITVPAYFNDNQRKATKDAGEIAGLDVIRIINEPTAAALSYGYGRNIEKVVAVYDFGGGTFDISILEIGGNGVFKVIATAGDTFLGGEDVDARIIDWLVQGFREEHNIDLRQDRMALQRLKDAAEKAKCELSSVRETEVNLPFIISSGRNEALHLQRSIDRQTLEELSADLIERTVDICRQTLEDARLDKDEIEEVLLVGGMTRTPKIQMAVQGFFEREPSKGVHPDECVALGAAVQGMALLDQSQQMILLDVTPHALGIMTQGGYFEELIPQNTTVPTHRQKIFTTSRDNQTAVKILVMQGESERADENELLGEFILTGLRRAPKGQVEIEVTFEINADGIVSVRAKDLETAKEQSIDVTASSGLTRDEVQKMVSSAKDQLVERRSTEEFEAAKQEAERLVGEIERL
ncbi:MAG: molecular chaperone DnaK, partial [Myxococcales bacterium]